MNERNEPFLLAADLPSLIHRQKIKLWYDDFTGEFYPADRPIYNKRMHKSYSLHYVIEGHGYFGEGDEEVTYLSPGDLFYISAGSLMRYYPCREEPWRYCGISTEGGDGGTFFAGLGFGKTAVLPSSPITMEIGETIRKTVADRQSGTIGHYDLLACLCRVFSLLENACRQKPIGTAAGAAYAERAKEYLELHYSEPTLRMAELARALNLSHPYLCRIFRQHVGIAAETYLRQYRMTVAKHLLCEQHYTVTETALLCGYTDQAQFSRMYKKEHGVSPRQDMQRAR